MKFEPAKNLTSTPEKEAFEEKARELKSKAANPIQNIKTKAPRKNI